MAATSPAPLSAEARNRLVGVLLLGLGAMLLLVSLFLDWFEPGLSAWTVFEAWDLVLAALMIMALVAVASRLEFGAPRPDGWLLIPALVAPVVVVAALLNPPPAAQGPGQDPMIGIWLALAGSLLMALGALVSIARISVALDAAGSRVSPPRAATPGAATPPGAPPAATPPAASPAATAPTATVPGMTPAGAPADPAPGDEPTTRRGRRIFR